MRRVRAILATALGGCLFSFLLVLVFFLSLGLRATQRGFNREVSESCLRISAVYFVLILPFFLLLVSKLAGTMRWVMAAGSVVCLASLVVSDGFAGRIAAICFAVVFCAIVVWRGMHGIFSERGVDGDGIVQGRRRLGSYRGGSIDSCVN